MRTADFGYELPRHLIAQIPVEPRDHSRLLVLNRKTGGIEHRRFYDLPQYVRQGDLMVFNDSRVMRARLYGHRVDTGAPVEFLLLRRLAPNLWHGLGRPGRRLTVGAPLLFEKVIEAKVMEVRGDGSRVVWLESEGEVDRVGRIPLPPYVHTQLRDMERYQTVYARASGSVAAPTAGLHFTLPLLDRLRERGVRFAFVTLHVGLDTFRPVKADDPRDHVLHREWWEIGVEAARELNEAMGEGRRVVCVGTTSVRLLEQAAVLADGKPLLPASGWADLFILPGHRFRVADAVITNFHLPHSSLLMMVCAFAGRERLLETYREAIIKAYRFYSFGDGMVML